MDQREEKWLQEIRDSFMDGLDEESLETEESRQLYAAGLEDTVLECAEDKKRFATEFEKNSRAKGAHWPENLFDDVFRLKWVELKDSVDGESLEKALSLQLEMLTERESKMIELFYKEEKGLIEIAEEFNVFYPEIYSVLWKALIAIRRRHRSRRLTPYIAKSEDEPDPYGFNDYKEE